MVRIFTHRYGKRGYCMDCGMPIPPKLTNGDPVPTIKSGSDIAIIETDTLGTQAYLPGKNDSNERCNAGELTQNQS